jgi:hypothetical protein
MIDKWNKGLKGWTNSGSFKVGHKGYKNKGNFKKGQTPWNKGNGEYMKGEKHFFFGKHHSKESRQKISLNRKGTSSWNKSLTLRKGKYKNNQESHLIWTAQKENLSYVPKGFVLHHLDFNTSNNNLNNLFLMTNKDHSAYHNQASKLLRGLI